MKALIRNIRAEKAPAPLSSVEDRKGGPANLDMKRLLNIGQNEVVGLDIGSSSVKTVQLRKGRTGYTVTAAGVVDIENEGETDPGRREINTARAIQQCLGATAVQTRLAVCGLCGPEVAVRHFKFPALPPGEIDGAIMLEASQICPFGIDDSTVDYQLMPDGPDSISGVLVAATNKLIKRKNQLVKDASLGCVLMDVDGLALLNCLGKYENSETGRTTAVLNVGGSFTTLAIVGDNKLPFVRDMAYAGEDIVRQIAAERGIAAETVGRILAGTPAADQAQPDLTESLAGACRKLVDDVTETLRYYAAQESAVVEKIFVCGGFALVKGFVELLDSQLDAAVVLWNPLDRMRCDAGGSSKDVIEKNGPAMAVAAGLAMRSI